MSLATHAKIALLLCAATGGRAGAQAFAVPHSTDPAPFPEPSQPPPARDREQGFFVGLRAGYGFPIGQAADGMGSDRTDLSRALRGVIPLQLSVGFRTTPLVYLGLFVQYGVGLVGAAPDGACPPDARCSGYDLRAGAEIELHGLPHYVVDPWFGASLGYEYMRFAVSPGDGGSAFQGMEFVAGEAGIDVRLAARVRLGPFMTATLARYSTASTGTGSNGWAEIQNQAFHGWLLFGLRTHYDF